MKRFAPLLLFLPGCCGKDSEPTVRIKGESFKTTMIRTRAHFREFLRWDPPAAGRAFVVAYPHAHYHHYESRNNYDVVFTDGGGKVLEVLTLAGAEEGGITSSVEATHAVFLRAGTAARLGLRTGESVELAAPLRENLPPLLAALRVNGHGVNAWTAVGREDQAHGFMFRRRLSRDDGMIFAYPSPEINEFWMKNCAIDLDIAFFRSDGTLINVVETRRYPDPKNPPETRSRSHEPAQYVLETNFGWFRARGMILEDGRPNGTVRIELPPDVRS
ncbi:MAG: DUF192 domain-containing protein [Planctomycetes bacterium]|nr:DUF192 domain-containing protein [Planctomycetota bacterium]